MINVTKPILTNPDHKKAPRTLYNRDPQGFIYVDDYKRNRHYQEYRHGVLPIEKWSTLEKKELISRSRTSTSSKGNEDDESLENLLGDKLYAEFDESDTHVLERFDTSAGNPVNDILLKLNLPDHKSILTDSKVTPIKHGRMTKPYSSPRFIANCFNAGYLKMEVKVPDSS
ncbi:hypothetical protein Tco_0649854 [Tanacetum coccineum]